MRTDDITLILAYIDVADKGKAPRPASKEEIAQYEASVKMGRRLSMGTAEGLSLGLSVMGSGGEIKPVRRGLSEEKQAAMAQTGGQTDEGRDDELLTWELKVVPKTEAELDRIRSSVMGNFLFHHLNPSQADQIFSCMQRKQVVPGEVVINQGDLGEWFYVVDSGEYSVSLDHNGVPVEIMVYRPNPTGANPCFGELAIMYDRPRAATVTAATVGLLWAIDRKSFKKILMKSSSKKLMRTLRSVDVLKSLTVTQLQRLSELLTEESFQPGEFVIKQGEEGDTFYIIEDGSASVTKNAMVRGDDGKMTPGHKELGQIFPGQYFGERALLKNEPRAANVIAQGETQLKCLYISKAAFEEVLGPLQKLIDDDATWRYQVALVKQLKKNAAGLTNAKVEDFKVWGVMANTDPVQYVIAKHKKKEYTIKCLSKSKVTEMGMQSRLRHEMQLLTSLNAHRRFVPLALTTFEDDSYIYAIYPTRVSVALNKVMESEGPFPEKLAMYYAASAILALDHLHQEAKASGGIVFRYLSPDAFVLDSQGYLQMLDMRYACKAEPPPRDLCGYAHYYAPEQVSGQGHGTAADYWGLGLLIYEMVSMANPWITGDPAKDSEVAIFARIASHEAGALKFPEDVNFSVDLAKLLNELVDPDVTSRLGCRPARTNEVKKSMNSRGGSEELRENVWFDGFLWGDLANGVMPAPHLEKCENTIKEVVLAIQSGAVPQPELSDLLFDIFEGEQDEFQGFVPEITTVKEKQGGASLSKTMKDASSNRRRNNKLKEMRENRMKHHGLEMTAEVPAFDSTPKGKDVAVRRIDPTAPDPSDPDPSEQAGVSPGEQSDGEDVVSTEFATPGTGIGTGAFVFVEGEDSATNDPPKPVNLMETIANEVSRRLSLQPESVATSVNLVSNREPQVL